MTEISVEGTAVKQLDRKASFIRVKGLFSKFKYKTNGSMNGTAYCSYTFD